MTGLRHGIFGLSWRLVVMVAVVTVIPSQLAQAAPNQPQAGVTLNPAIEQLVVSPNQTSYSFSASASNTTNQILTFGLSAVDFTTANQSGGVAFYGSDVSSVTHPHGLATYLSISPSTLMLGPNTSQTFKVTVEHANLLSPGGHYAAVLLHVIHQTAQASNNHVAVNQVLSMLVFTATDGSGTQILSLTKPSQGIAWFHLPTLLNLFVSNSGNTQTTPRGYVTLTNRHNTLLSRTIFNNGSALILPGSTRLLQTQLTTSKNPMWPGVYHLSISYGYAGSSTLSTEKVSFLYVGKLAIWVPIVLLIVLLGWLVRRARSKRRYRLYP